MTTPILGLTEWAAAQSAPWNAVNQTMRVLEFFATGGAVEDRDLATPPGSPGDGSGYLVAASATGAWSGQSGKVAVFVSSGWLFFEAKEGMRLYVKDENLPIVFNGSAWV